tara:strand:+ start:686 stop:1561 length:876 start_codon:yes stop_codon:yes gene_type:complete
MSETKFKILDLFSGVGGFSLGLERTGGFETVAFCEQDEKAKLVLNKNWPTVPVYGDIKELTFERLQADGLIPTVITGGFPCQDISSAGKGEGIIGERSGLWSEMFRLIRDVRPAWAIIENVSTLRSKGLTLVLQNLCEIGYCAEWHCIPASAVGAPHQRDRIWIVAQPHDTGQQPSARGRCDQGDEARNNARRCCQVMADATRIGMEGCRSTGFQISSAPIRERLFGCLSARSGTSHWQTESNVGRVADGVPNRMDRLKQLGNAVVPQIPQLIGEAILTYEKEVCKPTNAM